MGAYLQYESDRTGSLVNLFFDVVTQESPNFPNTITEHVVEKGANVSDHVRVGLIDLALEVRVSNEPVDYNSQWAKGTVSSIGPVNLPDTEQPDLIPLQPVLDDKLWITLPIGVPIIGALFAHQETLSMFPDVGIRPTKGKTVNPNVLHFNTEFDAVRLTQDQLERLRQDVVLITVYGTKGVYEDMVIDHFSMERSADTGTGAKFTIQLKQIRFVASKTVAVATPAIPRGAPTKKSNGAQTTTPIAPGQQKESILNMLKGWVGGQTTIPSLP